MSPTRLHVVMREPMTTYGGVNSYVRTLTLGQQHLGLAPVVVDRVGPSGTSPAWTAPPRPLEPGSVAHFHFAHSARPFLGNSDNTRALEHTTRVMHFHGPWAAEARMHGDSLLRSQVKRLYEWSTYRGFSRFVTTSEAFRDVLTSGYRVDPAAVSVVTPGVDTERFRVGDAAASRRQLQLADLDGPVFLTVRRLEHRMGIDVAIRALGRLASGTLLVAGVGPVDADLRRLVAELRLDQRVRFLGAVSPDDLPVLYSASDAVLVPTRGLEGFGLVVLEAYAAGRAVIATRVGGLPSALGPFAAEWLVPPESVDALSSAMATLAADPPPDPAPFRTYAESRGAAVMARLVEDALDR